MRRSRALLSLIIIPGCLMLAGDAGATSVPGAAIRVSPAISNLQLYATQTDSSVTTLVTNLTSGSLSVGVNGRDFGALNQSGAVGFFGSSYNPATNPHSLQGSMSFPVSTVYLAPHASQKIMINLDNLKSLAAGGHFGAVLFTPVNGLSAISKPNVAIRSSVASLIFLTTANGGTQNLHLLTFHVASVDFILPSLTYIGFHNSGNTQAAVNGQLTLFGPNGGIVSTTVVNSGSGLVLPGTSRVFPVALPLRHTFSAMPGVYHLRLQYQDGTRHAFTTVSERFYYVNLAVIGPAIVLLLLLIYVGKKRGKRILRSCGRLLTRLLRFSRKKPAPVVTPPLKKRRPPLIQG